MSAPTENSDTAASVMFRDLSTSTKLFLLCSAFIIAIGVAIYALVAQQRIAIEFARKEVVGVHYLETLRDVYAAILAEPSTRLPPDGTQQPRRRRSNPSPTPRPLRASVANPRARTGAGNVTARAVAAAGGGGAASDAKSFLVLDALAKARNLATRIGDDSNLALDPDLDTYYLQDIVVRQMPGLLGQIGNAQNLIRTPSQDVLNPDDDTSVFALTTMGRSTIGEIGRNLSLRVSGQCRRLAATMPFRATWPAMLGSTSAYFDAVRDRIRAPSPAGDAALDHHYKAAVDDTVTAWAAAQTELARLLDLRIGRLLGGLYGNLFITGALAALSILLALITTRNIVRPLARLEALAGTVSETKDYRHRSDYDSEDEIGRLAKRLQPDAGRARKRARARTCQADQRRPPARGSRCCCRARQR